MKRFLAVALLALSVSIYLDVVRTIEDALGAGSNLP